jgi:tetratricopeptide (TPR) repeat protein
LLLLISKASLAQQGSSPREQLKQYVADLQKNPDDRALREKIIRLVLTITPKPSVPPEALESEGAAEFAFKNAKSSANYADAARQYEKALLAAPWVAADYFNLGVAKEKADLPRNAIESFELYLMAAPEAEDATEVRKRIGGLKYGLVQQETEAAAERARRNAELEAIWARERAALQAREREEEQRTERLARIDPLIRSLNGATYFWSLRQGALTESMRFTISQDTVLKTFKADSDSIPIDERKSYPIQGQTFYWDMNEGTNFCRTSVYKADECGYVGTITEKGIAFQFVADGKKKQRLVAGPPDYIPRQ